MNNKLTFYILLICFPIDSLTKDDRSFSVVLQTVNPKKTLSENQKKIARAVIISLIAGTVYYCAKDNQTPFLQTTVTDYATSVSISLVWNAFEQLFTKEQPVNLKTEIPLTIGLHATTQLSQAALGFLLTKIGHSIATDQVGNIATFRNSIANFLSAKTTTISLKPALGTIAVLQAAQYYYRPMQRASEKQEKFEQVLKDLELKEFIEELTTTDQQTLSVNFPDQRFAVAYFKHEAAFTNNRETTELAEQLENNSIDATKQPLIINVAAARESQFFLTWILQASKTLQAEVKAAHAKQNTLENYSQYMIKASLPLQGNSLTKTSIAVSLNSFLNLLRKKTITDSPTTRSPFGPLLPVSEIINKDQQ